MMLLQQKVSGKFELKMFITGDGLMNQSRGDLLILEKDLAYGLYCCFLTRGVEKVMLME